MLELCIAATFAAAAAVQTAPIAPVEQESLAVDAFSTGLVGRSEGGLGADMWNGAASASLGVLLAAAPAQPASPAIGEALRRVLLSRGRGPDDPAGALGAAKLAALTRAGFYSEARQIEAFAANAPANLGAMALADLAVGDRDGACAKNARMPSAREERIFIKLRILCYVAADNLDAAGLAFGILRERGALAAEDVAIFSPLVVGARAGGPLVARDLVQRAALEHMKTPLAPDFSASEAGVAVAVMRDASAAWPTRIAAARAAVAAGVVADGEARALFAAVPLTPAQVSGGADAGLRDAAQFQAIAALSAPEFAAERAARIDDIFAAAAAPDALHLAVALYAAEFEAPVGAATTPQQAIGRARAAIAAGDAASASRALGAATAQGPLSASNQADFARALTALSVLDDRAAAGFASEAGIAIAPPAASAKAGSKPTLAPVAAAAIAAAANGARGQSALAALAAAEPMREGDAVAAEIFRASFIAAGLADLAARHRAIEALFAGSSGREPNAAIAPAETPPAASTATQASAQNRSAPRARELTPRLKPSPAR